MEQKVAKGKICPVLPTENMDGLCQTDKCMLWVTNNELVGVSNENENNKRGDCCLRHLTLELSVLSQSMNILKNHLIYP